MLKHVSQIEIKVGEKLFRFICDMDSSLDHVKEAIFQVQKLIGQIEDQVKANIEAKKPAEEPKKEEIKND